MRTFLLGLSALALTQSAWAAAPPSLEAASSTSPYASSLSDFRGWSEPPVGAWKAANEVVRRNILGHVPPAGPTTPDEALQREGGAAAPVSRPNRRH